MGSGTTALAAIELNRNFLGFEISEEYVKLAKQRIAIEGKKDEDQLMFL
jgi:site-specific DNA-methyltransferase (adenine-specific)